MSKEKENSVVNTPFISSEVASLSNEEEEENPENPEITIRWGPIKVLDKRVERDKAKALWMRVRNTPGFWFPPFDPFVPPNLPEVSFSYLLELLRKKRLSFPRVTKAGEEKLKEAFWRIANTEGKPPPSIWEVLEKIVPEREEEKKGLFPKRKKLPGIERAEKILRGLDPAVLEERGVNPTLPPDAVREAFQLAEEFERAPKLTAPRPEEIEKMREVVERRGVWTEVVNEKFKITIEEILMRVGGVTRIVFGSIGEVARKAIENFPPLLALPASFGAIEMGEAVFGPLPGSAKIATLLLTFLIGVCWWMRGEIKRETGNKDKNNL